METLKQNRPMAKKFLMDVVLIRLTLIFLLVLYHAFCPFTGDWEAPPAADFHPIGLYRWLGVFMHHFCLESMVYISGLLFGYTLTLHPERLTFQSCIVKKAKRILLPGLLFSVLYYLLFYDLSAPWFVILDTLFNGCGHLWFLPMIFWCFVICYLLETWHVVSAPRVLAVSALVLLLCEGPSVLGMERVPQFFFYFYFGFAVKRGYMEFPVVRSWLRLLLLPVVYVVLCFCHEMVVGYSDVETSISRYLSRQILLLCASSMIVFLYNLANRDGVKCWLTQRPWLITLSGYCYGVYIYQQFVLRYLYYKTSFAAVLPVELLPWMGFLVGLALSLGLCHLTLKTRWGRYMIG